MRTYRNTFHQAIASVECPYCSASTGVPCKAINSSKKENSYRFSETHKVRVNLYDGIKGRRPKKSVNRFN